MDYLVDFVRILAWPIVVFILAIMFRHEAKAILARLLHLKYGSFEATFEQSLREAERMVGEVLSPLKFKEIGTKIAESDDIESRLNHLIEISPRQAISEAWIEVETAVNNLADKFNISKDHRISKKTILNQLRHKEIIDDITYTIYNKLLKLRNEISDAHATEITFTISDAKRYVELAKLFAKYVEHLKKPHSNNNLDLKKQ